MGSVLKDKDKHMKSSASRYSALAVSAAVVGIALLLFQAYSHYTGKAFKPFNFEVGSLWDAESNSPINDPIEETDIVLEVIPQRSNLSTLIRPEVTIPDNYFKASPVKNARFIDADRSERAAGIFELNSSSLERIEPMSMSLVYNSALAVKYQKQLQNDYLVNPNLEPDKGRWYVGFSFAPSISYRSFNYSTADIAGAAYKDETYYVFGMTQSYRNNSDRMISTYSAGVDVGVAVNDRFTISTGLYYSVYGESISISTIPEDDINVDKANYYGHEPLYSSPDNNTDGDHLSYDNRYSYIEVPLNVEFCVKENERSSISIQAGTYLRKLDHVNALIYDFETDFYYWLPKNGIEIYNDLGIGVSGGVSISQFVSKHVEVFMNPQFKYNLSSTFDDCYPVDQHHYTTGLRLGIKQHLN